MGLNKKNFTIFEANHNYGSGLLTELARLWKRNIALNRISCLILSIVWIGSDVGKSVELRGNCLLRKHSQHDHTETVTGLSA